MQRFKKFGEVFMPGDKDYDLKGHERYPWNVVGKIINLPAEEGAEIEVLGFYIRDERQWPHVGICKNCKFPLLTNEQMEETGYNRKPLDNPPEFFQYAGEAFSYIKGLGLSLEHEEKLRIVALAKQPDGLNKPMPTHIFMNKDALKER